MALILLLFQVFYLVGIDMRKKKINLRVQPIYSIVIFYVLGLISLFFILMPTILSWKSSNLMIQIIWYLVLILFFLYGFVKGTLYLQFAEIDKECLVIKNLFHVIAVVKWSEISSVKKEKILTYESRGYICLEWIVIRTDESQETSRVKYNRKGVFPLLIIANKKNLSILSKYIKIIEKNINK